MSDVTQLQSQGIAFRYQQGDFTTALRLALEHPEVCEDLEEVFSNLLFGGDCPEDDANAAREVLFGILEAASAVGREKPSGTEQGAGAGNP